MVDLSSSAAKEYLHINTSGFTWQIMLESLTFAIHQKIKEKGTRLFIRFFLDIGRSPPGTKTTRTTRSDYLTATKNLNQKIIKNKSIQLRSRNRIKNLWPEHLFKSNFTDPSMQRRVWQVQEVLISAHVESSLQEKNLVLMLPAINHLLQRLLVLGVGRDLPL